MEELRIDTGIDRSHAGYAREKASKEILDTLNSLIEEEEALDDNFFNGILSEKQYRL